MLLPDLYSFSWFFSFLVGREAARVGEICFFFLSFFCRRREFRGVSVGNMSVAANVESEATKFLEKVGQDFQDEPKKLASKLYAVRANTFALLRDILVMMWVVVNSC
jgi:hypothetical protein